jgi:outer membrane immunogenic protein
MPASVGTIAPLRRVLRHDFATPGQGPLRRRNTRTAQALVTQRTDSLSETRYCSEGKHMKMIYKFGAAAVLSTSMAGTAAFAGNLSDPVVETVVAPVYAPVAVAGTDWTGAYGGLNLGYADVDGTGAADGDDMTYGLHLGYDYDFGRFVLGGELEYDKADIDLNGAANTDSVTRLKLRGGYDLGRTLIYATAGAARLDSSIGKDTGEFVGLGVAYQVTDRFTVGGEILEHRFDNIGGTGVEADATTFNLRGSLRF